MALEQMANPCYDTWRIYALGLEFLHDVEEVIVDLKSMRLTRVCDEPIDSAQSLGEKSSKGAQDEKLAKQRKMLQTCGWSLNLYFT